MTTRQRHEGEEFGIIEATSADARRCPGCGRWLISFRDEFNDVFAISHLEDNQARELAFVLLGNRIQ